MDNHPKKKIKLLLIGNFHLYKDENHNYYSPTIYDYHFLKRYLSAFDTVRLAGKVKKVSHKECSNYNLVSGSGVEIHDFPWYQGMRQLFRVSIPLIRCVKSAYQGCHCCIFRVAQVESFLAYIFRNRTLPFALEIVNDPESMAGFSNFEKKFSGYMLRKMLKKAAGASYVTKKVLQKKYPLTSSGAFEGSYSSVELRKDDISDHPIHYHKQNVLKIAHVSNAIGDDGKGHITLINAIERVVQREYSVQVTCVGDGTKVNELKKYVNNKGLSEVIQFPGRINGHDQMMEFLRSSDLLVFPTRSEGLPRTVIEAMAAGLPCLSTPVGGIPELLEQKYLFDPDDDKGFANEICRLMNAPDELYNMSKKNIKIARRYHADILQKERTAFYMKLRNCVLKSYGGNDHAKFSR